MLTPNAPLANGTSYDASVIATDKAGNAMAGPYGWSFVTATASGATPASLWTTASKPANEAANDTSAIELGVKFIAEISGSITAIRYYRGPGNAGPHVGNLWDAQGTLLGSATFDNETEVGWQQANLATPVPITGGQTYIASYHAPSGRYSYSPGALSSTVERAPLHAPSSAASFGNGVYRYGASAYPSQSYGSTSYSVDVVFLDDGGPAVVTTTPAAGAVGVSVDTALTVTFSEAVAAGTMVAELRDGGGGLVPVTVTQDSPTAFTITPDASLNGTSSYTATIVDARDGVGNGLSAPFSWSFTTADTSVATLFGAAVPATRGRQRPVGHRARYAVRGDAGRRPDGHPLLSGPRQQRASSRPPVDGGRRPTGRGDLCTGRAGRLAVCGTGRTAGADTGRGLRRVLLHPIGQLCGGRRLLQRWRRRQRTAGCGRQQWTDQERPLRIRGRVPHRFLQRRQLLGGCRGGDTVSDTIEPLGLAVIGAGYWGPNLVRNAVTNPATELRWICDLDLPRAQGLASTYAGVSATGDLRAVLDDPSVEAVAIATPASTHAAIAIQAVKAGKHVRHREADRQFGRRRRRHLANRGGGRPGRHVRSHLLLHAGGAVHP